MRRLNWSPGSSAHLCSDHFTTDITTDSYDKQAVPEQCEA